MSTKNPLFEILEKIDDGDLEWIDSEDNEKEFKKNAFILSKWFGGTSSSVQIKKHNVFVNPYVFSLSSKHPKLYYYLMCIASNGNKKRYQFNKTKKNGKMPLTMECIVERYEVGYNDAKDTLVLLNEEKVKDICLELGKDKEQTKKILKEWK